MYMARVSVSYCKQQSKQELYNLLHNQHDTTIKTRTTEFVKEPT